MIKALAEMGGVMVINFSPFFLLPREETMAGKHATVQTVIDHIDHIAELVGTAHMGLGSNYNGIPYPPDGLNDASKILNITLELVRRGYSEGYLKKILGGIFLRVMRAQR